MYITVKEANQIIDDGIVNLKSVAPILYDHLWKLENELIIGKSNQKEIEKDLLKKFNENLEQGNFAIIRMFNYYDYLLDSAVGDFYEFLECFLMYIHLPEYLAYKRDKKLGELINSITPKKGGGAK